MWEFISFGWKCLLEGWHIGEGAFAWIEGVCFLISNQQSQPLSTGIERAGVVPSICPTLVLAW